MNGGWHLTSTAGSLKSYWLDVITRWHSDRRRRTQRFIQLGKSWWTWTRPLLQLLLDALPRMPLLGMGSFQPSCHPASQYRLSPLMLKHHATSSLPTAQLDPQTIVVLKLPTISSSSWRTKFHQRLSSEASYSEAPYRPISRQSTLVAAVENGTSHLIYNCWLRRVAAESQAAAEQARQGAEAALGDGHKALRGAQEAAAAAGPAGAAPAGGSSGPLGFTELAGLAAARLRVWQQNNPNASDLQASAVQVCTL